MIEALRLNRVGFSHLQDVSFTSDYSKLVAIEAGYFKYLTELHRIFSGELSYFGDIYLDGTRIEIINERDALNKGIYCIGFDKILIKNLSVVDNLSISNIPKSYLNVIHKPASSGELMDLFGDFGLNDIAERKVETLSEVERYKLSMIKAILGKAKIVVLWNSDYIIDTEGIDSFISCLNVLKERGILVIYLANHIREELIPAIDQLILLQRRVTGISFFDKEDIRKYLKGRDDYYDESDDDGNIELKDDRGNIAHLNAECINSLDISSSPLFSNNDPKSYFANHYTIAIDGKIISDYHVLSRSNPTSTVFPNLSVKENVCFYGQKRYAKNIFIDSSKNDYLYERMIRKYEYFKPLAKYNNRDTSDGLDENILFRIELARIIMIKPSIIILINAQVEESVEGAMNLREMIHDLCINEGITFILISADTRNERKMLSPDHLCRI